MANSLKARQRGFTLIELLLISFLVPLIAFAVYSNFSASTKIWKRLHKGTTTENLNIFYEKTSQLFLSAFIYTPIPFEADENGVIFAGFIESIPEMGGENALGEIHIYYDPKDKTIKQTQRNMNQIYKELTPKPSTLFSDVKSFRVSFFKKDNQEPKYVWIEQWDGKPEELPVAVRFEFEYVGDTGIRTLQESFMIPAGG